MAYPDCKVGFEYQGAYHASPEQMRKDAARFNELQHNGWTIIMRTVLNKKGASPTAGQTHTKYAETALFRHSQECATVRICAQSSHLSY